MRAGAARAQSEAVMAQAEHAPHVDREFLFFMGQDDLVRHHLLLCPVKAMILPSAVSIHVVILLLRLRKLPWAQERRANILNPGRCDIKAGIHIDVLQVLDVPLLVVMVSPVLCRA